MKVLLVEGNTTHRMLHADILRAEGCEVETALPEESVFRGVGKETFANPEELADILAESYDAAVLDRETFRAGRVSDGSFLMRYLAQIWQTPEYKGRVVVTTTLSEKWAFKEGLESCGRLKVLYKCGFDAEDLCQAVTEE